MELSSLPTFFRSLVESEPGRSPLRMAKIAADEAVCALRRARMRPLPDREWQRISKEVRAAAKLFTARGWVDDPAGYHTAPPPLTRPRISRARTLGMAFEHVRFASEYVPHRGEPGRQRWQRYRPNRTAHAWVLRQSDGARPWIVCLHGYGMGAPFVDLAAFQVPWLYGELGLNVLIPVLPLHGPRKIGWASGDGYFSGDCLDTVHAEAQAIWDLRRLLGWIRSQGARAIGMYGLSLGGYTAALLGAFEADLACVIAGVPPSDFLGLARHHTPPGMLAAADRLGFDWTDAEKVLRVVSPLALRPLLPRERCRVFGGLEDRIVPPAQVRQLCAHWGDPQTVWYDGSHLSFHWEPEVRALVRQTLRTILCDGAARAQRRTAVRVAA